jgi:hypothetical protein
MIVSQNRRADRLGTQPHFDRRLPPAGRLRLRLKPKGPESGYVDGAWWPRGDHLATELPDLLAVLSVRLGPVHRVVYHLDGWAEAPVRFAAGGRRVELDGYRHHPAHTLAVQGVDGNGLVLLVVPPDTPADDAHLTMMTAARPGDTSTVESLLIGNPSAGAKDACDDAAGQRWDSEGGAIAC